MRSCAACLQTALWVMLTWTRSSRPAFPHPSVYRTAAAWSAPRLLDRHDDASSTGASTGGARAPSLRTCRALALAVPHAMLSAVAASPTLLQQVASAQDCNWQRALRTAGSERSVCQDGPTGPPRWPQAAAPAHHLHSCRGRLGRAAAASASAQAWPRSAGRRATSQPHARAPSPPLVPRTAGHRCCAAGPGCRADAIELAWASPIAAGHIAQTW